MDMEYETVDPKLLKHELRIKKELRRHSLNIPRVNQIKRYTDKYCQQGHGGIRFDAMIFDLLPEELHGAYTANSEHEANNEESETSESKPSSDEAEDDNDYNKNYYEEDENNGDENDEAVDYD